MMEAWETSYSKSTIFGGNSNETISIIENAGLMGIKIPQALQKGIDILAQKTEGGE